MLESHQAGGGPAGHRRQFAARAAAGVPAGGAVQGHHRGPLPGGAAGLSARLDKRPTPCVRMAAPAPPRPLGRRWAGTLLGTTIRCRHSTPKGSAGFSPRMTRQSRALACTCVALAPGRGPGRPAMPGGARAASTPGLIMPRQTIGGRSFWIPGSYASKHGPRSTTPF